MAMRVNKTAITRLSVDVSCGCKMYSEFTDPQCKSAENESEPKTFVPCDKHSADLSLSMLEFMIGERLEEAIAQAQKEPVVIASSPVTEDGGIITKTQAPANVRPSRLGQVPKVKTLERNHDTPSKANAMEIDMDKEAEEDEVITGSVLDILGEMDDEDRSR